jgi:predicted  nucleic acid-binding Zn-ribbon protein
MKTLISLVSLAACGAFIVGCASTGFEKAGTTSTSLREAARDVDNTLVPLDNVVATLSDLVTNPGPDITPQYQKFNAAVSNLESLANEVKSREAAMREQGAAYFQKWDEELAKIQNDNIQTRSLDRKNSVAAQFEKVRLSYSQTSADFAPFMSDIKDIRTALSTDLTAGGLASVKGLASQANDAAKPLRESLIRLSAEFRKLGVSISTTTPPKAD